MEHEISSESNHVVRLAFTVLTVVATLAAVAVLVGLLAMILLFSGLYIFLPLAPLAIWMVCQCRTGTLLSTCPIGASLGIRCVFLTGMLIWTLLSGWNN